LPVSGFVNRNQTQPKILTKKIIDLLGFFFGSVFLVVFFLGLLSLLGFSVFLLTPTKKIQAAPALLSHKVSHPNMLALIYIYPQY
jgi:hypothetical protein